MSRATGVTYEENLSFEERFSKLIPRVITAAVAVEGRAAEDDEPQHIAWALRHVAEDMGQLSEDVFDAMKGGR